MTDNEIVKALECCGNTTNACDNCSLIGKLKDDCRCCTYISTNALDLINRQKAQLIKEQNKNSKLRNERNRLKAEIESVCIELDKTIIAKDLLFDEAEALIKKARAEAIKEFAERLKKNVCNDFGFIVPSACDKDIDNLVKEMVGDDDENKT